MSSQHYRVIALAAVLVLAFLFWPRRPEPLHTTSTLTQEEALRAARAVASLVPRSEAHQLPNTGSMRPMLHGNCYVILRPITFEDIRAGMVIAHHHKDDPSTHRVIARTATGWTTKGDNNRRRDPVEIVDDGTLIREVVGVVYFQPE